MNCCDALHLFPNPNKALEEVVRVLKPEGRFTLATFRKGTGFLGRLRSKSALTKGVDSFTPEGTKQTLERLGMMEVRILHEASKWKILCGWKG